MENAMVTTGWDRIQQELLRYRETARVREDARGPLHLWAAGMSYLQVTRPEAACPTLWPWDPSGWMPGDTVTNQVRAGGLFLEGAACAERMEDEGLAHRFYGAAQGCAVRVDALEFVDRIRGLFGGAVEPIVGFGEVRFGP